MAESPDLEKLARQYLDLWQDQLAGIAGDEEIARTMARTLELMNTGAQAVAGQFATLKDGAAPEAHERKTKPKSGATTPPRSPGAPGPETTAPSSGHADLDLDQFARRLAGIEQRLARLEGKPEKPGGGTGKKPRKRKS